MHSQKKNLYDRYTKTQVLIIDEVSMLHAYRLDMVDKLARMFRGNQKPFGGMQIIMCGTFSNCRQFLRIIRTRILFLF